MSSNQQPPNMFYPVANGVASSNPFVITFQTRDPTGNDVNYPIQKKWFNKSTDGEWTLVGFTSTNGILQADWRTSAATQALLEFTGGTGTTGTFPVVPNGPGEILLTSLDNSLTITGSANALDFKSNGSGFPWTDITGTVNAAINNGYMAIGLSTSTLPASPVQGSTIRYVVNTASLLTIQANTGQFISVGQTITAAAGTAVNTLKGDSMELIYQTSSTTWISVSGNGQWNLT